NRRRHRAVQSDFGSVACGEPRRSTAPGRRHHQRQHPQIGSAGGAPVVDANPARGTATPYAGAIHDTPEGPVMLSFIEILWTQSILGSLASLFSCPRSA